MSPPAGHEVEEDLAQLFAPFKGASGVLIAVSGGPDSIALMHLLARWRAQGDRPVLIAATVDHGLRPEAAQEAGLVARQAAGLGIAHQILAWTGPKPAAGLQAAARAARYGLLLDCARLGGATHLVTAHTLDDQAETLLMRLSRGSGLSGLAGMRREVDRGGIRHVRPLLGVTKASLIDLCRRENWAFVEDPSNRDERFARARWRRLLPALAGEGLTAERLAVLAERVSRAEEALDEKARSALSRARASDPPGADHVLATALRDEPFEIALRILGLMLREGREDSGHLRLERLERALERLREAGAAGRSLRLTLAGQVLDLDRHGSLHIEPEPPRHRGRYAFEGSPSGRSKGRAEVLGKAERDGDDAAHESPSLGKGGRDA